MAIQKSRRLQPLHPGEVLKELLTETGLTANALALALRVPANRIGGIVNGRRGITGDTSLRLARYFGTSAQMWMNLQAKYDLAVAEDAVAARIQEEVRPRVAA
jgi:addiction module HigA family antidote